ncbi:MAG: hypothetical protein OHK0046_22400 [Anaerolineae bacterium]
MFGRRLLLLLLLLLLPAAVVFMQDDGPSPTLEITGVNANNLPTVLVNASILDRLGQPVRDLQPADIIISGELEDIARVVDVQNVQDDNLPLALVLVIDTSSSMSGSPIDSAKEAARLFVDAVGDADSVAILTFDTDVRLRQDFTTDKDTLRSVIDALPFGGQTALYDAGLDGVDLAANSGNPRRAVILLSDGAEFGGVSDAARGAAIEEATIRGVPVYTIGLGFGIDRTYLQELSAATNARNYESPTPEELPQIYAEIANLLRTQYVITLEMDVPADGTEYELTLQAETDQGVTNEATATVRAPIPVPLVDLDGIPADITEVTEVTINVLADDALTSVTAQIDESEPLTFGEPPYTLTIDPELLLPGEHTITVTAIDENGDTGTDTATFNVGALPSRVTISPDLSGVEISQPTDITVEVTGQTPAESIAITLGDQTAELSGDAALLSQPTTFTIDPSLLQPGAQTLSVSVTNAGGVTSTVEQSVTIAALPSDVVISPDLTGVEIIEPVDITIDSTGQTAAETVTVTLGEETVTFDETPATFTIDPMAQQPGQQTLTVELTNAGGVTTTAEQTLTIGALPTSFTIMGIEDGDVFEAIFGPDDAITALVEITESQTDVTQVSYSVDGQTVDTQTSAPFVLNLPVNDIGAGQKTLTVDVTNAGGVTSSETVTFEVRFLPTPTPTIDFQATADAQATSDAFIAATNAEATAIGIATADALATSDAVATSDAQATGTVEAQATSAAVMTADANATGTAVIQQQEQATQDAQATAQAEEQQATADAQATQQAEEQQATQDAQATQQAEEQQATQDADATEQTSAANMRATQDVRTMTAQARDTESAANTIATRAALATQDASATENALSTLNALDTATAVSRLTEEARLTESVSGNVQVTDDAQATETSEAELQATQDALATVDAQATETSEAELQATQDALATVDAQATETSEAELQATQDALATVDAQATETSEAGLQATQDALATVDAQATESASVAQVSTADAAATNDAQATLDAEASLTAEPTLTPTVVPSETPEATEELTAEADATGSPARPTVAPLTEESTDEGTETSDNTALIVAGVACAAAALLLLLVLLLLRRRGRNNQPPASTVQRRR